MIICLPVSRARVAICLLHCSDATFSSDETQRYLNATPLFHVGTLLDTFATFLMGGTNLFLRQADAAAMCAINLIAQIRVAVGDLDRVKRVVRLGGYVQAGPDFFDIPKVLNGCSDLMVEAFGNAGRHARSAVGVYRLPLNFAVEVDAIVEAL